MLENAKLRMNEESLFLLYKRLEYIKQLSLLLVQVA